MYSSATPDEAGLPNPSVQDLARYVAERWPTQAQPSKHNTVIAESEQPTVANFDYTSINRTLAGLVRDLMATEIPLNQPFMEVR